MHALHMFLFESFPTPRIAFWAMALAWFGAGYWACKVKDPHPWWKFLILNMLIELQQWWQP